MSLSPLWVAAQHGASGGEWRTYGGDQGSTKYSTLSQIDKQNVRDLRIAWTWVSIDEQTKNRNPLLRSNPAFGTYAYEATPLFVDGVLYTTTSLGAIAAINPETGGTVWSHDPGLYLQGRPPVRGFVTRGSAYWTDGKVRRLFYAGGRGYLASIDAATGKPDPMFGDNGLVDLKLDLGRRIDPSQYGVSSPPMVVGDVVVVGSVVTEGAGYKEAPPGHVRAYDAKTGRMRWIFHTIPQLGEYANDTWGNDSWKFAGGANVWTPMSADEELGYVYLAVASPVTDFYGGYRPGDNLFANSLVCLDARTGKRVWHYQIVHHSVWDYDLPAAPTLMDITVAGKTIRAVAQITNRALSSCSIGRRGRRFGQSKSARCHDRQCRVSAPRRRSLFLRSRQCFSRPVRTRRTSSTTHRI